MHAPAAKSGTRRVSSETGVKGVAPIRAPPPRPASLSFGSDQGPLVAAGKGAPPTVNASQRLAMAGQRAPPPLRPKPPPPRGPPTPQQRAQAQQRRANGGGGHFASAGPAPGVPVVKASTLGAVGARSLQSPPQPQPQHQYVAAAAEEWPPDAEHAAAAADDGVGGGDAQESESEWSQHWDDEVESYYYFNHTTGEASWVRPPGFQ
jgi:hypothetical protein